MAFAHKLSLGVINCLNGEFKQASSSPFVIGSGSDSDLVIQDDSVLDQHCLIEKTKKGIQIRSIQSDHPDGSLILDGKTATLSPLKARTEHSLQIGRSFLILVTTLTSKKENLQRWGMGIGNGGWIINKSNKAAATRPLDILEVFSARDTMDLDPNSTPVFKGSSQVGFYLSQLMVLEPEKDNLPDESISDSDEELVADRVDEISESTSEVSILKSSFSSDI